MLVAWLNDNMIVQPIVSWYMGPFRGTEIKFFKVFGFL